MLKSPMRQVRNKNAYFFAFTGDLTFAAGNCALSLNRHNKYKQYDIVMYCSELSRNDIDVLSKIPNVIVRDFDLDSELLSYLLANIPCTSRFRNKNQLMCLAHFEAFGLLEEYEKVVWYDVDIGFQRDCSSIFDFAAPFGILPDTPWKVADQFTEPVAEYVMDTPAFCTAAMALSNTLPHKAIREFLYENAWKYARQLYNPDQAVINLAIQAFNIKPILIPPSEYCCFADRDEAITARAVHFGTDKKVWNNTNLCCAFPEWYRTHLEWLDLGGSDFERTCINPKNAVCALNALERIRGDAPYTQ